MALQTVSNYTLLETVGQGTFGEVMLAVERHTRESVAVKILEKDKITDDDARQRLVNEIAILHRVQHPNLVQVCAVGVSPDGLHDLMPPRATLPPAVAHTLSRPPPV